MVIQPDLFNQNTPHVFKVHTHEKGKENNKILNKNRNKLSKRQMEVFLLLMTGVPYTTRELDNILNMSDSRKRISELIKLNGVRISIHELKEDRYKKHGMTKEDIEYNQKFLN